MSKAKYFRRLLNAWIFGTSLILLADEPTAYHGFTFGLFLMLVIWDTCDFLVKEAP